MAQSVRIAGVEVPPHKKTKIALTYVFGIGQSTAEKILNLARVDGEKRAKDLTDDEVSRIRSIVESDQVKVEGELRQDIYQNIKRLKDIRSYRGIRHKLGLPVRGQRTRTNAHTRKGKHIAVGGLKHKLEKT
jgi:small subunit ribosomal protein S13